MEVVHIELRFPAATLSAHEGGFNSCADSLYSRSCREVLAEERMEISSNHCLVYMTDPTVQNIEFEAALPTPIHYRSKNLEHFGRTVV